MNVVALIMILGPNLNKKRRERKEKISRVPVFICLCFLTVEVT